MVVYFPLISVILELIAGKIINFFKTCCYLIPDASTLKTHSHERASLYGISAKKPIDVKDGAFVEIYKEGIRTHIPVGCIACTMLEPGTRVSYQAVALAAARSGSLLV